MTDIQLKQGDGSVFDLDFDGSDLVQCDDLENAVILSVETEARARVLSEVPDLSGDFRGWWADSYMDRGGEVFGSRSWTLSRAKMKKTILSRCRQIFEECLSWMVGTVADSVVVDAELVSAEIIRIKIRISKPGEDPRTFRYFLNWEAQELKRSIESV